MNSGNGGSSSFTAIIGALGWRPYLMMFCYQLGTQLGAAFDTFMDVPIPTVLSIIELVVLLMIMRKGISFWPSTHLASARYRNFAETLVTTGQLLLGSAITFMISALVMKIISWDMIAFGSQPQPLLAVFLIVLVVGIVVQETPLVQKTVFREPTLEQRLAAVEAKLAKILP